jgi:hypothetical protein
MSYTILTRKSEYFTKQNQLAGPCDGGAEWFVKKKLNCYWMVLSWMWGFKWLLFVPAQFNVSYSIQTSGNGWTINQLVHSTEQFLPYKASTVNCQITIVTVITVLCGCTWLKIQRCLHYSPHKIARKLNINLLCAHYAFGHCETTGSGVSVEETSV